ncbi:MAG: GNAT family N-acetyltransferase, partial [Deltaproteobacteria bacterium]|nr:GNAT family N-acetyltransferase [Deltaproteobacteria bacterium]
NLQDLELIQLGSFGEAISVKEPSSRKFRLKTFYSGWLASEAVSAGRVDLIPSRPSMIVQLFKTGQIQIDMAFFRITPPDEAGYCSLGVAVDVAVQAMEQASLSVGEVSTHIPRTYGDSFIHISDLDMLVSSTEPPIAFNPLPVDDILDRVAGNVASVIEDGSCLSFSVGPFFEAFSKHLVHKRHLGIHSPFFTDCMMELVKSGAVTNRRKANWRGKSVVSYAFGSPELMVWLDRNPLVEFQGIDKVFDPIQIGHNPRFVVVVAARKVDLTGRIALHMEKGRRLLVGRGGAIDFFNGADLSPGGRKVIALSSRDPDGAPNILLSVEAFPIQFSVRESLDMVITEYGVANLNGRTIRERAQALIDVAHPDDRQALVGQAKEANLIYKDQIFLAESVHLYPSEIDGRHIFKGNVEIRFRALRPSDEEEMRRLFYRFSDKAVYYRYFTPVRAMPHIKMQEYVNVDLNRFTSVVGLEGDLGKGKIIAEARFAKLHHRPYADVAFIVDEEYHGLGIASYLFKMLVRLAKERGVEGFTALVLTSNKAMMRVFEKSGLPIQVKMEEGVFSLTIPFSNMDDNAIG